MSDVWVCFVSFSINGIDFKGTWRLESLGNFPYAPPMRRSLSKFKQLVALMRTKEQEETTKKAQEALKGTEGVRNESAIVDVKPPLLLPVGSESGVQDVKPIVAAGSASLDEESKVLTLIPRPSAAAGAASEDSKLMPPPLQGPIKVPVRRVVGKTYQIKRETKDGSIKKVLVRFVPRKAGSTKLPTGEDSKQLNPRIEEVHWKKQIPADIVQQAHRSTSVASQSRVPQIVQKYQVKNLLDMNIKTEDAKQKLIEVSPNSGTSGLLGLKKLTKPPAETRKVKAGLPAINLDYSKGTVSQNHESKRNISLVKTMPILKQREQTKPAARAGVGQKMGTSAPLKQTRHASVSKATLSKILAPLKSVNPSNFLNSAGQGGLTSVSTQKLVRQTPVVKVEVKPNLPNDKEKIPHDQRQMKIAKVQGGKVDPIKTIKRVNVASAQTSTRLCSNKAPPPLKRLQHTKPQLSADAKQLKAVPIKGRMLRTPSGAIYKMRVAMATRSTQTSKKDRPYQFIELDTNCKGDPKIAKYHVQCISHLDSEEYAAAANFWTAMEGRKNQEIQTVPVSIKDEADNDSLSDASSVQNKKKNKTRRERSPDITDTPSSTPVKQRLASLKSRTSLSRAARGAKRKLHVLNRSSSVKEPPSKMIKNSKQTKSLKSNKNSQKISIKKATTPPTLPLPSSPHIASDNDSAGSAVDDGEKTEVQVVENSEQHVSPPRPSQAPVRKSTTPVSRGRGLTKVRGRCTNSGRGRGRPPLNQVQSHTAGPAHILVKVSEHHEVPTAGPSSVSNLATIPLSQPVHGSSPIRIPPVVPIPPTKSLKVMKPKKPKPVSVSRRKSRLKEKEDDEMQVTWDDGGIIERNYKHVQSSRREFGFSVELEEMPRKERIYLNDSVDDDRHENGGIIRRRLSSDVGMDPDSPSRTNDRVDSETDSASEDGDDPGHREESMTNNNNYSNNPNYRPQKSPSPPLPPPQLPLTSPLKQKQRLKSPLKPNTLLPMSSSIPVTGSQSQLPRITLPPPVFSTSLNKKPQKHVSVVDSLNLHLPTTATASSLAASSAARRSSTVGGSSSSSTGCGIFSNSQAMIANSRSAPGILQQQRKAQPHILSNSKAHQRTFIPTSNIIISSSSNSVSGFGGGVGMGSINTLSALQSNNTFVTSSGSLIGPTTLHNQVHHQSAVLSSTSPAGTVAVQIPGQVGNPITMSGGITLGGLPVPVNRTAGAGTNIIFFQKSPTPPTVVTSSMGATTNTATVIILLLSVINKVMHLMVWSK
jgi:hypothetical protein